jgi:hypothetical protein
VGAFLARQDIPWGGVNAYTRGQTVTDTEAIERNGWQDLVVPSDSKEAAEIKAELTGRPVSDFLTKTSAPASRAAAKTEG